MTRLTFLALALLLALAASVAIPPAAAQSAGETVSTYRIPGVSDVHTRSAIAATGAGILDVGPDYVVVEATPREARAIRRLGLLLVRHETPEEFLKVFPAADSNYHDYAEMVAELQQAAFDHPAIFSLFSLGLSYEGRTIWAGKISDNVGVDEDEPEVLFTHHQHAREHLTVEQGALYAPHAHRRVRHRLRRSPAWSTAARSGSIFDVNPDGGEFDIATGVVPSPGARTASRTRDRASSAPI